jgi:hypothetical protein
MSPRLALCCQAVGLGEFEGGQWLCSNSLPSQCPPVPVHFVTADESHRLLSDPKNLLPSLDELETQVRQHAISRAAMQRQHDAELVWSHWTARRHLNGLNKSIHSSMTRDLRRPQLLSAALSMKLTDGRERSTLNYRS